MAITRNINDDNTLSYLFSRNEKDENKKISQLAEAVDNKFGSLFLVKKFTRTNYSSIAAGAIADVSIPYTVPAGYTPVGVVGIGGGNNGHLHYCDLVIQSDTNITIWAKNTAASAVTPSQLRADVLFIRSDCVTVNR